MRHIAVFHKWHVDSLGWKTKEFDGYTEDEALDRASRIAHDIDRETCTHCDFILIPIEKKECIASKKRLKSERKLTLKERLLGKIDIA